MSALPRLPLTVIGGYLGAGKTTLLNRLLSEPHGQKIMVMVNDFGAINIDAALIERADGDTLSLTNGCVCCTMGNDLFMALGDALDRRPRPDHLVIEASGIADPAKIAMAARAEPDMAYGGIAVVVDGENWPKLADDPLIGAQMRGQVQVADVLLVSKTGGALAPNLAMRLAALSRAPLLDLADLPQVAPVLLGGMAPDGVQLGLQGVAADHPAYVGWAHEGAERLERPALEALLAARPAGIYRLKGHVLSPDGALEVHVVGPTIDIKPAQSDSTRMVAIGLASQIDRDTIAAWWATAAA